MHLVHEIFAKIEQEHSALWKNEKIFRQINYLAIFLYNRHFHENFAKKA